MVNLYSVNPPALNHFFSKSLSSQTHLQAPLFLNPAIAAAIVFFFSIVFPATKQSFLVKNSSHNFENLKLWTSSPTCRDGPRRRRGKRRGGDSSSARCVSRLRSRRRFELRRCCLSPWLSWSSTSQISPPSRISWLGVGAILDVNFSSMIWFKSFSVVKRESEAWRWVGEERDFEIFRKNGFDELEQVGLLIKG